ncbi:FtsW/RodA/SpoVE family cell cycle protein [Paenibacillus koleovorans]|uniref:FtsW/RodA/SpoVE family cell cycle protein n=1 Tax=Paenibacillus koleovorans TaxID=121608 RepID=UPI000FDAD1C7|nr:FtsW/RodA/SpoVE family cell cycle protein [Paenibacillus koleovorans]
MTKQHTRERHPVVESFLYEVTSYIRAREWHRDIRDELSDHLEDSADEAQSNDSSLSRDEAYRLAVAQMGAASEVGKRFDRIHRPRTDWVLLGLLGLLLGASFLLMYSMDRTLMIRSSVYPFDLFEKKLVYSGVGLLLLLAIRLFDYRKLLAYSNWIYGFTLVMMLITLSTGRYVNGSRHDINLFGIQVDVLNISPYALIVSLCGVLILRASDTTWWKMWLIYVIPPLVFYAIEPYRPMLLFYFLAALVLFLVTYKSWVLRIGVPLLHLGALVVFAMNHHYWDMRIKSFFDPGSDPNGIGYMAIQTLKTLREAGWFGQGIGQSNMTVPNLYSDMMFTYIVFTFGWAGGVALVWVVAAFLLRIVQASSRVLDPYGKQLIIGLSVLLGMQFIWSIGMAVGLLPIISVQLPLVANGGSSQLTCLALLGLIMSIYRRKDMIRSHRQQSMHPARK